MKSLLSFIGIVNLYHHDDPYFEIRLKPLWKFLKQYYCKPIPLMAWTPQHITLFSKLKHSVTSSPVSTWFDPYKPTFFNTDKSTERMGWILMQPANDKDSQHASTVLKDTRTCLFNLSPHGSRLQPVAFGFQSCTDIIRKDHSFVVETACG